MKILAHNQLGDQAWLQLERGGPAYQCSFGAVDTYCMIEHPEEMFLPDDWEQGTDEDFETIGQIKKHLVTHAAMFDAALPE